MIWYFVFFFVSGFCGILYEIVWLRLAMAQFGVTNALVSIVLSMFMAGLGLGSWGSGLLARRYGDRAGTLGLRLYALAELLIGISALLVPWCAAMGATIPLAMEAIRSNFQGESSSSFSFLYLANVVGATAGAIIPLFLIELYGFRGTLKIGAVCNCALAISAFALSMCVRIGQATVSSPSNVSSENSGEQIAHSRRPLVILLATGLTSMGLEVVWIRQFTPYLGTMVYAFATILALYLVSTLIGSTIYRAWNKKGVGEPALIWLALGFGACLSLAAGDPQFRITMGLRPIIGIVPFSMILGFITPMLVDRWSGGDPHRAGTAY